MKKIEMIQIEENVLQQKVKPVLKKGKTFCIVTLGCKVNQYESEAIREIFLEDGYEEVSALSADVYIVNTCTVTNMAARKSRQMLSRGKKKNPAAVVIAVGCYVQREHQSLKKMLGVDILIGNHRKKEILTILEQYYKSMEVQDVVVDGYSKVPYENLEVRQKHERTRATIKIQDGCNLFCTYCIIPYARGKVRSREKERILEEMTNLVREGYREFVITGIHLSSYGVDFSEKLPLIDLLEEMDRLEGVERIRLGSLEPRLITPEFAERAARLKSLCPHFHLSLQSGSDGVLKRMNRRYTVADFKKGVAELRRVFDNPAITTDIIVGFPGETEAEWHEGYQFVQSIGFADLHVFQYSKREGTKAAEMPDQISEQVKGERSAGMISLGESMKIKYLRSFLGKPSEVLWEETVKIGDTEYWVGHSREYVKVYLPTADKEADFPYIIEELFEDGMRAGKAEKNYKIY